VTNTALTPTEEMKKPAAIRRARESFGVVFWIAAGFVGLVVLVALTCQWLPLADPNLGDYTTAPMALPSWNHWFGTDELGRDTLSRVCYGARISVTVSFGTMAIGLLVGGVLGMISAFRGGRTDLTLNSLMIVGVSYPSFVAVLVILGLWQPVSIPKMILVLGIFSVPLIFILIRGATLSYSTREFVMAAKALGATNTRILTREVLPNVAPAAMTLFLLGIANVVVLEGSLAFLGRGIADPTASWGKMINEGSHQFQTYTGFQQFELAFFPGAVVFLFLVSLFLIGDKLRARYDATEGRL